MSEVHYSVGDWLYTNGATLLGVVVALGAAFVAWKAIQRQIKAERQNVKDQLDADRQERRRSERLNAISDAMTFVHETYVWAALNQNSGDKEQYRQALPLNMAVIAGKLALVDLEEQRLAVTNFSTAANAVGTGTVSTNDLFHMYSKALKSLQAAVDTAGGSRD